MQESQRNDTQPEFVASGKSLLGLERVLLKVFIGTAIDITWKSVNETRIQT